MQEFISLRSTQLLLRIYFFLNSVMYIFLSLVFTLLVVFINGLPVDSEFTQVDKDVSLIIMIATIFIMVVFGLLYFLGTLMSASKGKINLIFIVILLALGVGNGITMIPSILFILRLFAEDSKEYYLRRN